MSIKEMLKHWSEENVMVRDDDLTLLRALSGPSDFSYYAALGGGETEIEVRLTSLHGEFIAEAAIAKIEKALKQVLADVSEDQRNAEVAPQQWANRKK
jgi:hypothetical protein